MTFWDAVIIVGVAVLAIGVVEMAERWTATMFPEPRNTHQQARDRQLDSLTLASRYPPAPGPHGFDAQQDRRAHVVPMTKRRLH